MEKKRLYILCACILPLMVCTGLVYSMYSLYLAEVLSALKTHIGLIYMAGAAVGLLAGPLLGKLSDRLGRKPVILATMGSFVLIFILLCHDSQLCGSLCDSAPGGCGLGGHWSHGYSLYCRYCGSGKARLGDGCLPADRIHWLDDWPGFRWISLRAYWLAVYLFTGGGTGDCRFPSGLDTGKRAAATTSEHQEE